MASLISAATGLFTAATTFALVDNSATTGVSYLDSEAGSTTLTTTEANNETPSFLWALVAPTIDGIAVKIASRSASPTGTFTVKLRNFDAGTDVASATINVADITDAGQGGWYFFSLGSQSLAAATNYRIRCYTSSASMVTLYRDGTALNWCRQLRTTTTQAPASGDQLHVIGKWNSAGNVTAYTVTMDETATTSYGPTVSGGPPQGITVGSGGTWTNGTTAATPYYLRWKGVFAVYPGGTFLIATSGSRLASDSSAIYEMASVANVDTGFVSFPLANVTSYGDGARLYKTTLNTDEAAAATVLGMTATTGWSNGDEIVLSSTSATATQFEKRTITTVDSSTQVTVSSGLTNAHSGTSPTQCNVGNITRNITFRGLSASASGYVYIQNTATVVFDYVRFEFLGSGTVNKRGIEINTTTGSCTINKCAIIDGSTTANAGTGILITGSATNNITVTSNIIYNMYTNGFNLGATSGTSITVDSNLGIGTNSIGNAIFLFSDVGGVMTNNIASGSASNVGFNISETGATIGTFSGNVAQSNAGQGLNVGVISGTIGTFTAWRSVIGINIASGADIIINSPILFGNTTGNINSTGGGTITVNNGVLDGGATTIAAVGLRITGAAGPTIIYLNSTTFGATTAHSSSDITVFNNATVLGYANNCLFSTSTEFGTQTALSTSSYIGSSKHDQTAGSHKFWRRYGTGTIDTTIFDVTPAMRLTPNNASSKFESLSFYVAVNSGTSVTASIKARLSVAGDGTAYNGTSARWILKSNYSQGNTANIVLASLGSAGVFTVLSGSTPLAFEDGVFEFFGDCDGTTGWADFDTFTATPNADTRGLKFWLNGFPMVYGNNASGVGGGSFTFS